MRGLDVGLSQPTYWVWKRVCESLALNWDALVSAVDDPVSVWAWKAEVVIERFHPSILRRLAERALESGEPDGLGEAWVAAGGDMGHWLELDGLLRMLKAHREIEECSLLLRPPE